MSVPVIEQITTRLLTASLPRPWGETAPENHVIVVDVLASDGSRGTGFSWTPTIGPQAVRALLEHDIAPFAVGKPAHPRVLWDQLWRQLHEAGGGGMTTIAMAGLDLALWDVLATSARLSLAELIGQVHERVLGYGSGINLHYELDELADQARRWVARGYPGVKIKVGSETLDRDLERVATVREIIGPHRDLMVDANQRWDLPTAIHAVNALERFGLRWIEEPLRADDTAAYATLAHRISTPIALGENVHTIYGFRDLIAAGGCAVVQPNIVRVGGITPFLRIADLARAHSLQLAPHLLPDLSAQLAAALPERVWVEEVEDASFASLGLLAAPSPVVRDGASFTLDRTAGLGLRFR